MNWKKYKVGDRIFYKGLDGNTIYTDIVIKVEEKEYRADNGYMVKYQYLYTDECSTIENYNCIPLNSPELKDIKAQYALYDKKKHKLFASIKKLLTDFNKDIQIEALKELLTTLQGNDYRTITN